MLSRGRLLFITCSLLSVALLVSGTMLAASQQEPSEGDSPYKYLAVFMEVFGLVNKAYVDETDVEQLMDGAFEGVFDALDPFSVYVPAGSMDNYRKASAVGASHSGMVVLKEQGVAYAMAIAEGSPAAEAGLEQGDILATLNGDDTRGMPLFEIQSRLAGDAGTAVSIERLRQGNKEIVELALDAFAPPAVELSANGGIPILRIPSFHDGVVVDVATSLEAAIAAVGAPSAAADGGEVASDVAAQGDVAANDNADPADVVLPPIDDADKLLIDLRGVAGGDPQTAYEVASLFTGGELGALRRRERDIEVFTGDAAPKFSGRIAVLVDRSTQGAAEILVTVLRQQLEVGVIGEATFGHSGVLEAVELSDGGTLMITSAFFTGPDREPIAEKIEPDVWVRGRPGVDEDGEVVDRVLDRGVKFLLESEEVEREIAA
ncbi:MAG: S41 family peptidase [Acidobacteriota bacterium]